jgi:uncharacterized protein (DUF983 family)
MSASFRKQPNPSTNGGSRFATGLTRSLMRYCPFCGGGDIFENWFTLKKQCPSCGSIFEPEDGYMLGSYVVNLGVTALIGVLFVFAVVFGTDFSVLQLQIASVVLVVGFPLFFYGYAQLIWICIDLLFNSTRKFDPNRKRHT